MENFLTAEGLSASQERLLHVFRCHTLCFPETCRNMDPRWFKMSFAWRCHLFVEHAHIILAP